MKDNTLRELDNVLEHFYVVAKPLPNGNISINGTTYAIDIPPEVALKDQILALLAEEVRKAMTSILNEVIHQSTINLKSAKAVSQWAEIRIKQLEKEGK